MGRRRWVVGPAEAGERLDTWLASRLGVSRRRAMAAIEQGSVLLDGRRARKGAALVTGQEVVAEAPRERGPAPQPELPLSVVYEDDDLLVVDKPSGWPTHPLRPGETGTLANAVVAHAPSCAAASADPREGGATHRLDTPTSGLVIFAKGRGVWERLRAAFSERRVDKGYVALVWGRLEASTVVTTPIERTPGAPGTMRTAVGGGGREARTEIEPLGWRRGPGGAALTLVRCSIPTGVMHQIRVHLASLGHPIVGDESYGGGGGDRAEEGRSGRPEAPPRLFLHAATLGFAHPATGRGLEVEAPLPPDLSRWLEALPPLDFSSQ